MQPGFLRRWSREFWAQLGIASPMALSIFAQIGMLTTDTLMVSELGVVSLGAIGLASGAFYTLLLACTGLLSMATIRAAYEHGKQNKDGVRHCVQQGLWLGLLMTIPVVLIGFNLGHILTWLGQEQAIVDEVHNYMYVAIWSAPAQIFFSQLRGFVSTLARGQLIAVIMILGLFLNAFLNYLLIFGHWGFPELGIAGAGLATSIISWVMLAALIIQIVQDKALKPYHLFKNFNKIDWHEIGGILKQGWPVSAANIAENSLFLAVNLAMGVIGAAALAASNIVINYMTVVFIVPIALLYTSSYRVAFFMGQQNLSMARLAGIVSLSMGWIYMGIMTLVTIIWTKEIIAAYLEPDQQDAAMVFAMAYEFLLICTIFQVLDATQAIAGGALRGIRDTTAAFIAATIGYWVVGYPLGWFLCFVLDVGPAGIWWGLALGIATAAILLVARYYHKTGRLVVQALS